MFAFLRPTRAFLLSYVIGLLVLPVEVATRDGFVGSIVFTQSLRIDKLTACHVGVLIGSIIFAPHVYKRLRFMWVDALFAVVAVGLFATSMTTGLGPKDGLSVAMESVRRFLPLLVFTRLFITSAGEMYEAMRVIVGAGVVYAVPCLLEWRLSPQLHRLIYGYFPHSFSQFARYGFFRPLVFMDHAIEVSGFMGMAAALACWLQFKGLLKRPLWDFLPGWGCIAAIVLGLITTMTFSGIGEFALAIGVFALFHYTRSRWVLWLLPAAAIVWMGGRYFNVLDASGLLRLTSSVDAARSDSLEYRLRSERDHLDAVRSHVLFGAGAQQGNVGEGDRMAVDEWWMIQLCYYGVVSLAGWYMIWCAAIWKSFRHWKRLTPDLQTLAAATAILLGMQFIDFLFNSFPSMFLLILDVGMVVAIGNYLPTRARRVGVRVARPEAYAPMPSGVAMTDPMMAPGGVGAERAATS
ncbi:MAG TPA: hypothetical protein VH253_06420 [Phycisphaerae bacterium]|nr:hypothetical protein [Phycisphaerae bacterium]